MIYSDNTYDITNNIATYTRRDFKSVFDTASNKWYMLNNLDEYEEYGIYGDSFDTYYTGKLVIVNDREYEWNGTEWDDLGEYVEQVVSIYRDAQHTGTLKFLQDILNIGSYKIDFKLSNGGGSGFLVAIKANDSNFSDTNDWRLFSTGTPSNRLYYDCGNGRYNSAYTANTRKNYLIGGGPMKITDLDTQTVIYNGTTSHPNESGYLWYGGISGSADYGYIYDLVFYSDNNGQNEIAHYIPYIQNETVGMYDTINDVFVAATGTLGVENESVRPKDYQEKAAPIISTLWASTIYRNSAHLTTLMRNDVEQAIWSYMEDDILKKGEVQLQIDYLCFEANTAGSTIALSNTNISPNIEYSRDKNTWTMWNYSALTLQNVGDKIYMRGSNPNGIGLTETNVSKFIMTGSISASGNIMTLIDKVGETLIIPSNYCFRNLFRQCTSLTEANISLPATTLTNYCYDNIFRDCTNLSKAPVLVATNVNYTSCYRSMFNGCNALNKIITYAQTIGANSTEAWVDKVAATGDFYNLGGANYSSGANGIPTGWTIHTSL